MKRFFATVVANSSGQSFIFDTYNTYLITANSEAEAKEIAARIAFYLNVDEIEEVSNEVAEQLMKINKTKELIKGELTQIIMF